MKTNIYIFLLIIVLPLFGCNNKSKEFTVELYLKSNSPTDIQIFYCAGYFEDYSEENSHIKSLKENKPSVLAYVFQVEKTPKRLRIDFNTSEEISLEIDSLKIISNNVEYIVKSKRIEDLFSFNSQVEGHFNDDKLTLKTIKTNEVYDPYIITKNLFKYLY